MPSTANAIVTVEEYLHSVYEPDMDYVDGRLEDRNVGEYDHSSLQMALARYFSERRFDWNLRIVQEQRMQITPTRYRVPDTVLFSRDQEPEQIFKRAPLVCIEVLSPKDRLSRLQARVQDYFAMGVLAVWILDPRKKIGLNCPTGEQASWHEETDFSVEGTAIQMNLPAVFAEVD
jgi:Uma2 family endonuclease